MRERIVDVFTTRARELRQNATWSEKKLWKQIRNSRLGYKFRRQHVIGRYIVDFYCHELKLIIELDGMTHNDSKIFERDMRREEVLKNAGYHVLRYVDGVVIREIESVAQNIISVCEVLEESKQKPID